ncbi:unnamed protein product [Schistosoma bovis]|nr:unnamed protein product [Schistosoma bovis]
MFAVLAIKGSRSVMIRESYFTTRKFVFSYVPANFHLHIRIIFGQLSYSLSASYAPRNYFYNIRSSSITFSRTNIRILYFS